MTDEHRNERGQFTPGNPGGPGRPRRAVESDYLRTLSDAVDLNVWREIVGRAAEDAKAGDAKARAWLASFLLGDEPQSLTVLAVREALELSDADMLAAHVSAATQPAMFNFDDDPTLEARALRLRDTRARREADEAEQEAKRLKREAQRAPREVMSHEQATTD